MNDDDVERIITRIASLPVERLAAVLGCSVEHFLAACQPSGLTLDDIMEGPVNALAAREGRLGVVDSAATLRLLQDRRANAE